ncbi:DUF4255 domain-containing protein [Pseudenhygromyxa sp. WMMC2535]|uniref:DUF4255 domain-containing protein n=1 Tax=Pseudenhygromyxa sp. WMMC2535 TaxID=2712867 RepID=UPI001557772D|nr:DUF4255 domain-containing protein [Pseudenhygromyxa sp. WMMC2535]NVB43278.1 DUF4255 domain-containing protein [Pseudenhygromyxa sp. WMMC2535]
MIGSVLNFLRTDLDRALRTTGDDESANDKVAFVDGDKMDPLQFKLGAVSMLLVNVEEERLLRAGDRFRRVAEDGTVTRVFPDIRLSLQLLFVARFKRYDEAWDQLSAVLTHFQGKPAYTSQNTPALPAGVERLLFELRTFGFAEQNEIWNALRISHHPSVLYRVNLVLLRDASPAIPGVEAGEANRHIGEMDPGSNG